MCSEGFAVLLLVVCSSAVGCATAATDAAPAVTQAASDSHESGGVEAGTSSSHHVSTEPRGADASAPDPADTASVATEGDASSVLVSGETAADATHSNASDATPGATAPFEPTSSGTPTSPEALADASTNLVPMLSAVIDGVYTEFKRDVIAYNGRPPMMDIYGGMTGDAPPWYTLRVAVTPSDVIVPGEYECGPDRQSFIMLMGDSGHFDTTAVVTACTIVVESAGTQPGEVFSGTFEATVYTTDGARSKTIENGTFLGVVD